MEALEKKTSATSIGGVFSNLPDHIFLLRGGQRRTPTLRILARKAWSLDKFDLLQPRNFGERFDWIFWCWSMQVQVMYKPGRRAQEAQSCDAARGVWLFVFCPSGENLLLGPVNCQFIFGSNFIKNVQIYFRENISWPFFLILDRPLSNCFFVRAIAD